MSSLSKYFYIIAIIILIIGISFVVLAINEKEDFRLPGYILIITSTAIFLISFGIDFKKNISRLSNAEDEYVIMSKKDLIKELTHRKISYDENEENNREYLSDLLRKNDEENLLEELSKNEE